MSISFTEESFVQFISPKLNIRTKQERYVWDASAFFPLPSTILKNKKVYKSKTTFIKTKIYKLKPVIPYIIEIEDLKLINTRIQ